MDVLCKPNRKKRSFRDSCGPARAGLYWWTASDSIGTGSDRGTYRELIGKGILVPAGQILRGAGLRSRVLHNCFVTSSEAGEPVDQVAARITRWTELGAGVGINLDALFAEARHTLTPTTDVVLAIARSQQRLWEKGVTRTATMITLGVEDPDAGAVANMLATVPICRHLNLSVLVGDDDMAHFAEAGQAGNWPDPLGSLASVAWRTGNPGLLFTDRIARDHLFEEPVLACNPCAEQHLAAEEGCALASLNLGALCEGDHFDWPGLRDAAQAAVRFLDDVIEAAEYPDARTARRAAERRRVGIGVMGFATALHALDLEYGSSESVKLATDLAEAIRAAATDESMRLASARGVFPDIRAALLPPRRNSHLLSIAPTGAISLLWAVSSGIEPYFALRVAKETLEVFYPTRGKRRPKTAHTIPPRVHVELLSAWQAAVDGGISKTVNLPEQATVSDVCRIFAAAWRSGCKGISVFRAGCRIPAVRAIS